MIYFFGIYDFFLILDNNIVILQFFFDKRVNPIVYDKTISVCYVKSHSVDDVISGK